MKPALIGFIDFIGFIEAKLMKTDEADEIFSVAEIKTNSITDIFFWKYYLDLGSLQFYSWEMFAEHFCTIFS